jgi:hypothetical protein
MHSLNIRFNGAIYGTPNRNLRYNTHQFPMYGELARTVKIIQSNDSFKRNYIEYFG